MQKIFNTLKSAFVRKWLFTLLAFVTILLISFMVYTHVNTSNALIQEYISYSELQTEQITEHLDSHFESYSRVAAMLSLDEKVRIFLNTENASSLFPDIHSWVNSQAKAYTEGFPAIDSIYLFPAHGEEIFSTGSNVLLSPKHMDDTSCLSLEDAPDTITLIPRKKYGRYPYLMTIYLPLQLSGNKSMIVLNIDISQISILKSENADSYQKTYIVSDEGNVLYRFGQKDIPEPLSAIPQLVHFDNTINFISEFVDEPDSYVYVQSHSVKYPWYYVTVTTPQSYVGRTYNFYSTLITFLPWLALFALIIVIWLAMLITHPVYTITEFLENPQSRVPDNISAPETQKIIRQIINYVESNQMLSRELQQQMERQNKATFWALQTQINPHFLLNTLNIIRNMEIKTLGYDHEAPEMTLSLSRLLQYALDSTNLVPLKTEFHYTNLYLNILNQRYKNKLHFDIKKEDSISEVLIPKLILQPLIENAVFHGCSPRLDVSNNILVKATCSANTCFITIQDDGIGIPPETLASLRSKLIDIKNIPDSSIGLQNVALRMYLTYGNDFHIDIDSGTNKGTCITLSFPIHL